MGSPHATWTDVTGAIYTGFGSGEMIWTVVAAALCVVALVMGSLHEQDAYRRAGD